LLTRNWWSRSKRRRPNSLVAAPFPRSSMRFSCVWLSLLVQSESFRLFLRIPYPLFSIPHPHPSLQHRRCHCVQCCGQIVLIAWYLLSSCVADLEKYGDDRCRSRLLRPYRLPLPSMLCGPSVWQHQIKQKACVSVCVRCCVRVRVFVVSCMYGFVLPVSCFYPVAFSLSVLCNPLFLSSPCYLQL